MKNATIFIAIITALSLITFPDLEARGGGRGGGGGGRGGGGHRSSGGGQRGGGGGRTIQRSPSMSRTTQSRSSQRPQVTPSRPRNTPDRPAVTRPESRPAARPDWRPSQPQRPIDGRPTPGGLKDHVNNRPDQGAHIPSTGRPNHEDRHNFANKVRHDVGNNRHHRDDWFNDHYWHGHHHYPPYYHSHHNWWRWATPVGVAAWLGWSAAPIYYDYYYDNGAYYWGPTVVTTPTTVYVQQPQPVDTTVASQESTDDWMPLGVFALMKEGATVVESNIYLQLALNKNGIVSGSYYNAITDEGYEVEGEVDQSTQTVSMKIANESNSPVIETGVFNLTQSELPVQVHYADGRTANMLLIRLDAPTTENNSP